MNLIEFKKLHIPDAPGVYTFRADGEVLYIGKATSLRERLRSYFNDDVIASRGRRIVDMVTKSTVIEYEVADSVLEAFIRETELIKKYQPPYNSKDKDNKSFNYVVITKEAFPRVLAIRGRDLEQGHAGLEISHSYGPYPYGGELKEALKIIRKIFPFRDTCMPATELAPDAVPKPCFNRSIGLCPGVCTGEVSASDYRKTIRNIHLFFSGKKKHILDTLRKDMMAHAQVQEFEKANDIKKTIFALEHIKDVSMIKRDTPAATYIEPVHNTTKQTPAYVTSKKHIRHIVQDWQGIEAERQFRIESYDIAHLAGSHMVGVMVVSTDFEFDRSQYRKFIINDYTKSNDIGALTEVVTRRFAHLDWKWPDVIVVDGGEDQRSAVATCVARIHATYVSEYPELASLILPPVISVVKDTHHKAREILGIDQFSVKNETQSDEVKKMPTQTEFLVGNYMIHGQHIISLNEETHRFAITFHKKKRTDAFLPSDRKKSQGKKSV
jgi:excinuclease UvrABC nuclease subunit